METCAKTLEILCSEGHSLYTRCDVARSTIVDMIVASYKDAIDDWRNLLLGEETPNDDETFNVVSSLKKVSLFYACHNLNQWNLWGILFQDVKVSSFYSFFVYIFFFRMIFKYKSLKFFTLLHFYFKFRVIKKCV